MSRRSLSKFIRMAWGGGFDGGRNCVCPAACVGAAAASAVCPLKGRGTFTPR